MADKSENLLEKIVSLCKRRGFVFPGSEIYGGMANSWDYGPLGVELKNNIKQLWWKRFVQQRDDMVGLDAALIMNPKVWEASGHLQNFSDPLVECKKCHARFRADTLMDKSQFESFIENLLDGLEGAINKSHADMGDVASLTRTCALFLEKQKKEKLTDEETLACKTIIEEAKRKNELVKKKVDAIGIILREVRASLKFMGVVTQVFLENSVPCPVCGSKQWTEPKGFNLMFKTFVGPSEEQANMAYFRPETAQAMFVDFKNILSTSRKVLPFGIAQIGKAFRNEITPGNFIFRTREFEQMEIEYFIPIPDSEEDWQLHFSMWQKEMRNWLVDIGVDMSKVHETEISDEDRAFYSKRTIDFEFDYPFGQKELYGLAYRTNYDLSQHEKSSGQSLKYRDPETGEELGVPHVIEPSFGVDRSFLVILLSAYAEEEERVVLKLNPKLAPYKVAVFPLLKNKPELVGKAREIYKDLLKLFPVAWDERGNIGKRYYSQDEIGTPFCVTVDFGTLGEGDDAKMKDTVTVRDRDTMEQKRMAIDELAEYFKEKINM